MREEEKGEELMNDEDMPDNVRLAVERDKLIYGVGYAEKSSDGTWRHIPANTIIMSMAKPCKVKPTNKDIAELTQGLTNVIKIIDDFNAKDKV